MSQGFFILKSSFYLGAISTIPQLLKKHLIPPIRITVAIIYPGTKVLTLSLPVLRKEVSELYAYQFQNQKEQ